MVMCSCNQRSICWASCRTHLNVKDLRKKKSSQDLEKMNLVPFWLAPYHIIPYIYILIYFFNCACFNNHGWCLSFCHDFSGGFTRNHGRRWAPMINRIITRRSLASIRFLKRFLCWLLPYLDFFVDFLDTIDGTFFFGRSFTPFMWIQGVFEVIWCYFFAFCFTYPLFIKFWDAKSWCVRRKSIFGMLFDIAPKRTLI